MSEINRNVELFKQMDIVVNVRNEKQKNILFSFLRDRGFDIKEKRSDGTRINYLHYGERTILSYDSHDGGVCFGIETSFTFAKVVTVDYFTKEIGNRIKTIYLGF